MDGDAKFVADLALVHSSFYLVRRNIVFLPRRSDIEKKLDFHALGYMNKNPATTVSKDAAVAKWLQ